MSWLVVLLACQQPDPELVSQRDAIAAWERGRQALSDGEPGQARTHFQEARQVRPRDGLLLAWEARAAAEAGDLDSAILLLEEGLALQGGVAEARYNLAAYLVRAERPGEAARHLQQALVDGQLSPRDVLDDADFAEVLAHPAFAFLPVATLEADLDLPDSAVFWGSQATVELSVKGARSPVVSGQIAGPVELVSGIWDVSGPPGDRIHRYAWTVVVRGEGEVTVQDLSVRDGDRSLPIQRAQFAATAPPGKPAFAERVIALPTPEGATDLELPGVNGGAGRAVARAKSVQKVSIEPDGGRIQRFEQREEGRTIWTLHRWEDLKPGSYEVVIRDPGAEVLRQAVSVTATEPPPG